MGLALPDFNPAPAVTVPRGVPVVTLARTERHRVVPKVRRPLWPAARGLVAPAAFPAAVVGPADLPVDRGVRAVSDRA